MRAIAISQFGAEPELMELPKPEPAANEVLVRVKAAGLNPVDWKIAAGEFGTDTPLPLVLGSDAAGVVEAVGSEVTAFKPGDEVYGMFQARRRGLGSYAEYTIATPQTPMALLPRGLTFTQAAAVPTATTTGLGMAEAAGVDEGQLVLIVGATGGVGQAATQCAADLGAHVIATAAAEASAMMKDLGAVMTVDPSADVRQQVLAAHPNGIDVILDVVSSPAALTQLASLLRPGGVLVVSTHAAEPDELAKHEMRGVNFVNKPDGSTLARIAELLDAERIRVRVEAEVPLEGAPAALARSRAGGARGKTVIMV